MESATLRPAPTPRLTQVGLSGVLLALAAGAWILTGDRMRGMDAGPGTDLGGLGWFPAALSFARSSPRTVVPFVVGYMAIWTIAGLVAYPVFEGMRSLNLAFLAWHRTGRFLAAGVILAAAAYQLTAAKARCLELCRDPLRLASARRGEACSGLWGGLRHGAYCAGCCAGLMAALFALGVMSLTWMVAIAISIAAERLLPWHTRAVYCVAFALAVLGIWMAVAPADLPGLTLPGATAGM